MPQDLWVKMANLVFELEKKAAAQAPGLQRNIDRMKAVLEEAGLLLLNPLGEPYSETRTDLEASIAGPAKAPLHVVDVIKPVVYVRRDGTRALVQKGVVVVGHP